MMAANPVIHLADVRFAWPGAPAPCLTIASFTVAAGEHVFLYGSSGSGKSTLLALLGGVLVPQQGSVEVLGHDLARTPAARRDQLRGDHVGMLFQQFNLVPYLSVLENVLLPCRFSARRRARAAEGANGSPGAGTVATAKRLLQGLGLDAGLWQQESARLSVGQQQRVAAARALIGRPELIIADEPTSALDAARQEEFISLMLRECAAAQATLLFVSHDMRLDSLFTRVVALADLNAVSSAAKQAEAA